MGPKAQKKKENRAQGVSMVTKLPVSATKPSRGPCKVTLSVIFLFSSITVSSALINSVTTAAVEPPLREQVNENEKRNCQDSECGLVDKSPKVYTQLAREGVVLTQDSDNI